MTPSHQKDMSHIRPLGRIFRDTLAKYSWYVTRWAIGWQSEVEPFVFAYMKFPSGYVLHDTATVEDQNSGAKAQLVVFRDSKVEDPRLKVGEVKEPAMREGGYM